MPGDATAIVPAGQFTVIEVSVVEKLRGPNLPGKVSVLLKVAAFKQPTPQV